MIEPGDVIGAALHAWASFIWLNLSARAVGLVAVLAGLAGVALTALCAAHLFNIGKALGWL